MSARHQSTNNNMTHSTNTLKHIAIIMDGNGRWAKKRLLPRVAGHAQGMRRVREIVRHCLVRKIAYLTLFAFGRDNWQRPPTEVSFLMNLLSQQLTQEFHQLHEEGVKVRFVGDRTRINEAIVKQICEIEGLTANNQNLKLNIALDYSGTYDIMQAVNCILKDEAVQAPLTADDFNRHLLFYPDPHPDLLVRTSGESRLSDFMLWQLAYTECYFTATLWPDFDVAALDEAINWFNERERRFGRISEQISK